MEIRTADVEAVMAALDAVEAAWDKLASLPVDGLGARQVLDVLNRLEIHRRRQPTTEYALLNHLQSRATPKEVGAKSWRAVLSTPAAASARPPSSDHVAPSPVIPWSRSFRPPQRPRHVGRSEQSTSA
jgi:hypothetical protein